MRTGAGAVRCAKLKNAGARCGAEPAGAGAVRCDTFGYFNSTGPHYHLPKVASKMSFDTWEVRPRGIIKFVTLRSPKYQKDQIINLIVEFSVNRWRSVFEHFSFFEIQSVLLAELICKSLIDKDEMSALVKHELAYCLGILEIFFLIR